MGVEDADHYFLILVYFLGGRGMVHRCGMCRTGGNKHAPGYPGANARRVSGTTRTRIGSDRPGYPGRERTGCNSSIQLYTTAIVYPAGTRPFNRYLGTRQKLAVKAREYLRFSPLKLAGTHLARAPEG